MLRNGSRRAHLKITVALTMLLFIMFAGVASPPNDLNTSGLSFGIDDNGESASAIQVTIQIITKKINPGSNRDIEVSILTTEGFDAVRMVNISTVRFGPEGAAVKHNTSKERDKDRDGDIDLLLSFKNRYTGIQCGNMTLTLTGKTYDGQDIIGRDVIEFVGCGHVPTDTGSISGYKINDTNGNGRWDANEKGISGWVITLTRIEDGMVKETSTDATGFYMFSDLPAGSYIVRENINAGWLPINSTDRNITLAGGQSMNNNFTNKPVSTPIVPGNGSISGYKINDTNGNGRWDANEKGISGWIITLTRIEDGMVKETSTNATGFYMFGNLSAGNYIVRENINAGWQPTNSTDRKITLAGGKSTNDNFTNKPVPIPTRGSISGYKINDTNGNGRWDANEKGISGWVITLTRIEDGMVKETSTDAAGFYMFGNLSAGNYIVRENINAGWLATNSTERNITLGGGQSTNNNFTNMPVSSGTSMIELSQGAPSSGERTGCEGVITKENLANIKQYESREVYIFKGPVAYRFASLGVVKEVGFIANTDEGCMRARAELLKEKPTLASLDAPGSTYFNAWVGPSEYSESPKIENTYVIFSLPNEKNNVSVTLMTYKDGSWRDLKTEKIDAGTYKAYTPGFGSFAIVETLVTPSGAITQSMTQPTVTVEATARQPTDWALIIGVLVVIAAATVAYLKRKQIFEK